MFEAYRKQSEVGTGRRGSIDAAAFSEIPAAAKNVKIEGSIRLIGHMYEILLCHLFNSIRIIQFYNLVL